MSQQQVLTDMLARRRDRSIAVVLGMKEKECDRYLPRDVSFKLRKIVLDQINELCDFAVDVCNSLDTGDVILNEEYLRKLDDIHELVTSNGHR